MWTISGGWAHYLKMSGINWWHTIPEQLLIGLLAVPVCLLLSEHFGWFAFDEKKGWPVLIAIGAVGLTALLMLLWFAISLLLRKRFRYSLRSLLLVVLVISIPCSWLKVQTQQAKRQEAAVIAIRSTGTDVYYRIGTDSVSRQEPQIGFAMLRRYLGDSFFSDVVRISSNVSLRDPIHMRPFPTWIIDNETFVELPSMGGNYGYHTSIGHSPTRTFDDETLVQLTAGCPNVRHLDISRSQVTNTGLMHLKKLEALEGLELNDTHVTDAGMTHLACLTAAQVPWT